MADESEQLRAGPIQTRRGEPLSVLLRLERLYDPREPERLRGDKVAQALGRTEI